MATALQIEGPNQQIYKEIDECFTLMEQAQNLGSIMKFDISDATREFVKKCIDEQNRQHKFEKEFADLFHGLNIIIALTEKYAALAMNPPYMGNSNMNSDLSIYIKKKYEAGKADLFSTFMLVAISDLKDNGKYGMINMQSWMFLSSFEKLRKNLIQHYQIDSLLHLGPRTFDELSGDVVQNAAFVISNNCIRCNGNYFRLVDGVNCSDKELLFIKAQDYSNLFYPNVEQNKFELISGTPIGYWASEIILNDFENQSIGENAEVKIGMGTGKNDLFLKKWWEIDCDKIDTTLKSCSELDSSKGRYFPYNKGGEYRLWYGNIVDVCWYDSDGREEMNRTPGHRENGGYDYYFMEGVTWSFISSGRLGVRYLPSGCLFDVAGSSLFSKGVNIKYVLGLLSTVVSYTILKILNPTVNFQAGNIKSIPFIHKNENDVVQTVSKNIAISRKDWDAHETSWDFKTNPLLEYSGGQIEEEGEIVDLGPISDLIENLVKQYEAIGEQNFFQLHKNEEELNRQFIEIYGLQDELTPDVPLDEITIFQQGEISIENNQIVWHPDVIMKQFISYAIGCMMGRYRLDKKGLCIAHPNPSEEEYAPYEYHGSTFSIDDDGIIPLMSKDFRFDDNGVNRLTDFIKLVFGVETLTDNMNFLEEKLGKTVEQYLIKDFWKDHKKMYQNRPIYWLFSSKKGAFQVIAYMHRMNKYTVENIRNKYLLPHIDYLRQELSSLDSRITALTTLERKQYQKLQKDLDECMEYHDRLHSVADQQIDFDLDDGVVVNYAKFGDVLAKLK